MAGNGNGDNMLKVVELFIDNINESTKTLSQGMDKLNTRVENVETKLKTPPRNEELSGEHEDLLDKLDTSVSKLNDLKDAVKTMITAVRVAMAVLALAAIISTAVVYFGNRSLVNQFNRLQNIELQDLRESIEDLKGKGAPDDKVSRTNG